MIDSDLVQIPVDMSVAPRPAPEPGSCEHKQTMAECDVTYLVDLRRFVLEVRVTCKQCRTRFRFEKLPVAISMTQPCVDVTAYTVMLPIVPGEPA